MKKAREKTISERRTPASLGQAEAEVSVVIPDYGYSPYLQENITALLNGARKPDEIIIAHSGDGDPTEKLMRMYSGLTVLHRDERCYAGESRNRGVKIARGKWVACLDSDVCPSETWLEAMLTAANDRNGNRFVVGSVGYQTTGGYWGLCLWISEFSEMLPHLPSGEQVGGASCNFLVKRADFIAVGGFSSEFQQGEDTVLFARLRARGLQQWFAADAQARHRNIGGLRHYLRHQYHLGKWSALVRQRFALRGVLAVKFWPLAPFLWIARLGLVAMRVCRGGTAAIALFSLLLPGIIIGLITWNFGFLYGLSKNVR